jgi:hypothetical protein
MVSMITVVDRLIINIIMTRLPATMTNLFSDALTPTLKELLHYLIALRVT